MGKRDIKFYPKYKLTNNNTGEEFIARGKNNVLTLAGLTVNTPAAALRRSKKWTFEEIAPPEEWDQQSYRRELYKNTKERYPGYEAKKLKKDPLYERRKRARLRGWINHDGTELTAEQHTDMLEQNCALCFKTDTVIVVDHCHNTNVVRDALCTKCNLALGHVNDDVELLQRMIDYINKHKQISTTILGET